MKKVGYWIIDYLHVVKGQWRMFKYKNPPEHYLGHIVEGKCPVVVIQGIAEKWAFFKDLIDEISLKGHPVYVVPKLGYNFADIPSSAQIVNEVIDQNNLKDVILLAHSKGGLIGKYLMIHHDPDRRIKKLVAISTPFSGTKLAKFLPHRSLKEMRVDSQLIMELCSHTECNKKIVSIYPEFDNHVRHQDKSWLEGARNIEVSIPGHHKLLFNKDLVALIEKEVDL